MGKKSRLIFQREKQKQRTAGLLSSDLTRQFWRSNFTFTCLYFPPDPLSELPDHISSSLVMPVKDCSNTVYTKQGLMLANFHRKSQEISRLLGRLSKWEMNLKRIHNSTLFCPTDDFSGFWSHGNTTIAQKSLIVELGKNATKNPNSDGLSGCPSDLMKISAQPHGFTESQTH